ncbi:MAG: DUF1294 domain-containing protein [Ruminococcus sp.]
MLENILVVYLVLVNIAAFGMYGMDKQKAIRKQWRIPEAQLLCGGCHWRFRWGSSWNAVFSS